MKFDKHPFRLGLFVFAILSSGIFMSCEKDADNSNTNPPPNQDGKSMIILNLTDAPANYDSVIIDIQEVRVRMGDNNDPNDSTAGWYNLDSIETGKYDLLQLQNGLDTLLAADSVPSGRLGEIRLILGPDNYVVVAGVKEALKTPSAQQSGLKLKVNYNLQPGLQYEFWLDFNASKSIVQKGNGGYNLKPVIRVFTKNTTGSIEGYINPANASEQIYTYTAPGSDTVFAMADTLTGYFLLSGLDPATYSVVVEATNAFSDTTVTGVNVNTGFVTDLDTLQL